ncbi:MAG: insulinase family protein [Proteobacteria bacterium]|nr:insulinase family protein [Pseudomonadota bacterium]
MRQIARPFLELCLLLSAVVVAPLVAISEEVIGADSPAIGLRQLQQGVQEFTLSNGLRVLVYRRGDAPVFSGVVGVRVGGSDEQLGKTGISHMFEHMAFKGTSTIGTRDYARERPLLQELEELAQISAAPAKLPADKRVRWEQIHKELSALWTTEEFTREYEKQGVAGMNATTDTELTRYFESLPRSAFEFWCQMESARLLDPVMRQFYPERDVVMEERRMRTEDSPDGALYEKLLGVAFSKHPYRFPVIGHARDIQGLTATDVDNFRRRYYVPSNIVIALVGDVDAQRDRPMLERYFGRLAPGPTPLRPAEVEPAQRAERRFSIRFPASPMMLLGYHKPIYPHPDDAAISVMTEILAGSSISPLYTELVKNSKIALSVGADEGPGSAYPNLLIFALTPRAPHTNAKLLSAFDSVLKQFIEAGPTEEQLAIAKRAMETAFLSKMKSSLSLAVDLASMELIHGSWRAVIDWFDQVLRVSTADVQRVARTYLRSESRTVGALEKSAPSAKKAQ